MEDGDRRLTRARLGKPNSDVLNEADQDAPLTASPLLSQAKPGKGRRSAPGSAQKLAQASAASPISSHHNRSAPLESTSELDDTQPGPETVADLADSGAIVRRRGRKPKAKLPALVNFSEAVTEDAPEDAAPLQEAEIPSSTEDNAFARSRRSSVAVPPSTTPSVAAASRRQSIAKELVPDDSVDLLTVPSCATLESEVVEEKVVGEVKRKGRWANHQPKSKLKPKNAGL